jgi:hypothetical protein
LPKEDPVSAEFAPFLAYEIVLFSLTEGEYEGFHSAGAGGLGALPLKSKSNGWPDLGDRCGEASMGARVDRNDRIADAEAQDVAGMV